MTYRLYDTLMKDLNEMQDRMHMNERVDCYDMEKWIIDIIYDIQEMRQCHEEYEMELRDDIRHWESEADWNSKAYDEIWDELQWVKTLSGYGFNDYRNGKLKYA